MGFWRTTGKLSGTAARSTGHLLSGTAKLLYRNRKKIYDASAKAGGVVADVAAVGTKAVYDHREEISSAAIGVARGTAEVIHDASGHLIRDDDVKDRVERIREQGQSYGELAKVHQRRVKVGLRHRKVLLDTLVVGGETAGAYALGASVPHDIQRAYELAYPNVAATTSFGDRIQALGGLELVGFTSGVKGKLFELQYVDYLNDGNLPVGYEASLADDPNNAGWDIAISGPDSELSEAIQAKATDSVSYVVEALETYPHIDVVTTSEVYSSLVMQGYAEDVVDSGITDVALEGAINGAIDNANVTMDWVPSPVMLGLIAFSAYNQTDLTTYERSREFGERIPKSYLAYLVGGTMAVATGTWWIAVIGGVGSRLLLASGRSKRDQYDNLGRTIETNKAVIQRAKESWLPRSFGMS